jgi:integrase
MTVPAAAARFLNEAASRELRDSTLKKFRVLLTREPVSGEASDRFSPSLVMFAKERGIELLNDFTPDDVSDFRQAWKDAGLSKLKKSERLKAFFRFAHESAWIPTNPARNLRPPKTANPGVLAFTSEELANILAACRDERLKTFILVMRFSGLAIGDAVQLRPERLDGEHLTLRRTKTGKAVRVLLPSVVCSRLNRLAVLEGGYFFWNRKGGNSDVQTATGNMRRSLRRVFRAAGVPKAHPHQFRHLFVREHLEHDVSVETIADLLGNSVKIVEKHYSNWVSSRQRKLDDAVQRTWSADELECYRLVGMEVQSVSS